MKPAIRDEWAARLKSGRYPQGQHTLTMVHPDDTRKHCCLGVLCEMGVEAGVIPAGVEVLWDGERAGNGKKCLAYGEEQVTGLLPAEIMAWAELDSCDPLLEVGEATDTASHLNDGGMPFPEIAILIRNMP
jgi:hypothetical protein